MAEEETIIVNPKVESEETIFPSLGLSNFEKQMKAFNSYSALQKFRNETGVSPAFDFNTLGAYTTGNLLDLKNYGTSKFSVDFAGKVTIATPTADSHAATKKYVDDNGGFTSNIRVYLSSDQTITGATETIVEFDTETRDIDNEFNTSTYKFSPSKTGNYMVSVILNLTNVLTHYNSYLAFYKNSDVLIQKFDGLVSDNTTEDFQGIVYLTSSDSFYIKVYLYYGKDLVSGATDTTLSMVQIQ